ncbi:hypothetical protein AAEX28_06810 [Lentisphaerota bacterium WC36G]|nr:hypothetical protein LJT99_09675 [Lentisphaerae bacterium WC36]UDQ98819.1 hypothetical protein LJT99_04600 [Lentisphaerae bacterium WC36]
MKRINKFLLLVLFLFSTILIVTATEITPNVDKCDHDKKTDRACDLSLTGYTYKNEGICDICKKDRWKKYEHVKDYHNLICEKEYCDQFTCDYNCSGGTCGCDHGKKDKACTATEAGYTSIPLERCYKCNEYVYLKFNHVLEDPHCAPGSPGKCDEWSCDVGCGGGRHYCPPCDGPIIGAVVTKKCTSKIVNGKPQIDKAGENEITRKCGFCNREYTDVETHSASTPVVIEGVAYHTCDNNCMLGNVPAE